MAIKEDKSNLEVTRVLLADMPTTLAEVVTEAIQQCSDIRIVGNVREDADTLALAVLESDVLIVSHEPLVTLPKAYSQLLALNPALRLLSITTSSDMTVLYWMELRNYKQSIVTMSELTGIIRRAKQMDPLS